MNSTIWFRFIFHIHLGSFITPHWGAHSPFQVWARFGVSFNLFFKIFKSSSSCFRPLLIFFVVEPYIVSHFVIGIDRLVWAFLLITLRLNIACTVNGWRFKTYRFLNIFKSKSILSSSFLCFEIKIEHVSIRSSITKNSFQLKIIDFLELTFDNGVQGYTKNDTSCTTKLRNELIRGVIINLIVNSYCERRKIELKYRLISRLNLENHLKCCNINILISSWLRKLFQSSVNRLVIFSVFHISDIT